MAPARPAAKPESTQANTRSPETGKPTRRAALGFPPDNVSEERRTKTATSVNGLDKEVRCGNGVGSGAKIVPIIWSHVRAYFAGSEANQHHSISGGDGRPGSAVLDALDSISATRGYPRDSLIDPVTPGLAADRQ